MFARVNLQITRLLGGLLNCRPLENSIELKVSAVSLGSTSQLDTSSMFILETPRGGYWADLPPKSSSYSS